MAITVMRKPNKNSSFRNPNLSIIKNENVSMIVIVVPAHKGILSTELDLMRNDKRKMSKKKKKCQKGKKAPHILFDSK